MEANQSIVDQSIIAPKIKSFLQWKGCWPPDQISLAGKAGSNRTYYRIQKSLVTYVLSATENAEVDFHHFLRITQFYRLLQFPVPKVFCIDDFGLQVLLEDLGTSTFWDKATANVDDSLYQSAIDILSDLQIKVTALAQECPDIASRIFELEDLNWETDYFFQGLIEEELGIKEGKGFLHQKSKFQNLCGEISNQVRRAPLRVMHRDFQSQNLMVTEKGLRVIDYQGSRLGCCFYDIASLLFDPYVCLDKSKVKNLFSYFLSKVPVPYSQKEAWDLLMLAGVQRLMQAIGAYCFLARKKQLPQFEQYISPGVAQLKWVLQNSSQSKLYSLLNELGVWEVGNLN